MEPLDIGPDDDDPLESRVEPGSPSIENAVFVALGALSTVAVVLHLASVFG